MKTLYLKGIIGLDIRAEKLRSDINLKSTEKLRIIVNSVGGLVFEAYEIYDLLKLYKGEIEFVIMPYAASAMSYIVMAGKKISGFKNSVWMAHRVQTIFGNGNADDMEREAKILKGLENVIIEAYQTRLPGTKEEILQRMGTEIWGIGWEQLTDMGILDEVIDSVEDMDIPDEIKEDIEMSVKESNKVDIDNIISMRIKRMEAKLKDENIDYKNSYERIAAKLDIDRFENPYPNEHAARIREPGDFEQNSFRRKNIESGIDIIIGKLRGEDKTTTQAYRFKKDKFTAAQAKKWLKDNNIKYIKFEPASESNADNSAEDKNLTTEEDNMNLQEFLKSNPEAKAEYDKDLRTAEDKGRDEAVKDSDSVQEQKRIFDILECSGIQMSEEVAKAINEGTDASDFAMSELKRQRENRDKTEKVDFGKLTKNQLPGDQDKKGKEEAKGNQIDADEYDKKSDELANKFFGGAK